MFRPHCEDRDDHPQSQHHGPEAMQLHDRFPHGTAASKVPPVAYPLRCYGAALMAHSLHRYEERMQRYLSDMRERIAELQRAHPREFRAAVITSSSLTLLVFAAFIWLAYDVLHGLPSNAQLRDISAMAQANTLYDKDNKPAFTIYQERRIETPLSDVSPNLVHAIIAIEDQRFYEHSGIDVIRIMAAAATNLRAHRAAQGGSTLTQQLARQSFLSSDKTFRRKLKEAILAWRIEQQFTKDQILELYLNKVYFGDGLYGVERLLRQARARPGRRRGGTARRAGEVAVDLRPDEQCRLVDGDFTSPAS